MAQLDADGFSPLSDADTTSSGTSNVSNDTGEVDEDGKDKAVAKDTAASKSAACESAACESARSESAASESAAPKSAAPKSAALKSAAPKSAAPKSTVSTKKAADPKATRRPKLSAEAKAENKFNQQKTDHIAALQRKLPSWTIETLDNVYHRLPRPVYEGESRDLLPGDVIFDKNEVPIVLQWRVPVDKRDEGTWPPRDTVLSDKVVWQVICANITSRKKHDCWAQDFDKNGNIYKQRANRGPAANAQADGRDIRDIAYRGYYSLQGDEGVKAFNRNEQHESWICRKDMDKGDRRTLHFDMRNISASTLMRKPLYVEPTKIKKEDSEEESESENPAPRIASKGSNKGASKVPGPASALAATGSVAGLNDQHEAIRVKEQAEKLFTPAAASPTPTGASADIIRLRALHAAKSAPGAEHLLHTTVTSIGAAQAAAEISGFQFERIASYIQELLAEDDPEFLQYGLPNVITFAQNAQQSANAVGRDLRKSAEGYLSSNNHTDVSKSLNRKVHAEFNIRRIPKGFFDDLAITSDWKAAIEASRLAPASAQSARISSKSTRNTPIKQETPLVKSTIEVKKTSAKKRKIDDPEAAMQSTETEEPAPARTNAKRTAPSNAAPMTTRGTATRQREQNDEHLTPIPKKTNIKRKADAPAGTPSTAPVSKKAKSKKDKKTGGVADEAEEADDVAKPIKKKPKGKRGSVDIQ